MTVPMHVRNDSHPTAAGKPIEVEPEKYFDPEKLKEALPGFEVPSAQTIPPPAYDSSTALELFKADPDRAQAARRLGEVRARLAGGTPQTR